MLRDIHVSIKQVNKYKDINYMSFKGVLIIFYLSVITREMIYKSE